jgi:hypothetical protein
MKKLERDDTDYHHGYYEASEVDSRIRELEAQLAAVQKDAARWQAVKPMFRTMSANIDGNHTWTLARYGALVGASMDEAADRAIAGAAT